MTMWTQDAYLDALNFASVVHMGQKIPGSEKPYVVHLCQVAMEMMAAPEAGDLGVCCALLHDTIEDTPTSFEDIERYFGRAVADGVQALTKDVGLPKEQQMPDSLARIRQQPHQVWMVKMADRITNLQAPPAHWSADKRRFYQTEAGQILGELAPASPFLAQRLETKIEAYEQYFL